MNLDGFIRSVHRDRFEVKTKQGVVVADVRRSSLEKEEVLWPVIGDEVVLEQTHDRWFIISTKERRTKIERRDPDRGKGFQVLAANFHTIFIVMALNENYSINRLQRYLTVAWDSGARPVIILTKPDLAKDIFQLKSDVENIAMGVPIHLVNGITGEGIKELERYLGNGQNILLLGSSGVGKSTLTNALMGEKVMSTGAIRQGDDRGRHTTTHREVITLSNGASLMDTPGLRELGMGNITEGFEHAFPEIEEFISQCRFSNCQHNSEPGCGVKAALKAGTLSSERWKEFIKLEKEVAYAKKRQAVKKKKNRRQH